MSRLKDWLPSKKLSEDNREESALGTLADRYLTLQIHKVVTGRQALVSVPDHCCNWCKHDAPKNAGYTGREMIDPLPLLIIAAAIMVMWRQCIQFVSMHVPSRIYIWPRILSLYGDITLKAMKFAHKVTIMQWPTARVQYSQYHTQECSDLHSASSATVSHQYKRYI